MAEQFEDRLLALERSVLERAAGDFVRAVDLLRDMLADGSSGIERRIVALAIPDLEGAILAGVRDGYAMGGEWALTAAAAADGVDEADVEKARRATRKVPAEIIAPIAGLRGRIAQARTVAVRLLRNGGDLQAALSPLFAAQSSVVSTVVTQINAASNRASEQVGEAAGLPMVWEAERDACVHCLALAGEVVQAGESFPLVSYGVVPKSFGKVSAPPRHPNCRCRLAVLADPSYAAALKREAQRSVLRGYSLPTERPAVRVAAAKKLLENGVSAPKSVKQFARDAVKEGAFPTRKVPEGGPRIRVRTRTRTTSATPRTGS